MISLRRRATNEDIPSGKVKLLDGWVIPDESIAQG
jgi:hypothetical protein